MTQSRISTSFKMTFPIAKPQIPLSLGLGEILISTSLYCPVNVLGIVGVSPGVVGSQHRSIWNCLDAVLVAFSIAFCLELSTADAKPSCPQPFPTATTARYLQRCFPDRLSSLVSGITFIIICLQLITRWFFLIENGNRRSRYFFLIFPKTNSDLVKPPNDPRVIHDNFRLRG